ncbi:hypothetical protein [Nocardia bhagyanarayanae]|uniref:hypothetical protein n=1 Tax=Nocardia bhagyanarayanae TaxID=1215925 RepID=UPI00114D683B|nr:hypothetical protein [Nocardia bhagyanarayanae]
MVVVVLSREQAGDGVVAMGPMEQGGQPAVDRCDEVVLAQFDRDGMLGENGAGGGQGLGSAAVVDDSADHFGLHLAAAGVAAKQAPASLTGSRLVCNAPVAAVLE